MEKLSPELNCDICGKIFTNSGTVKWHKRQVHKIVNKDTTAAFQCELCENRFFSQIGTFRRHMKDAHETKKRKLRCAPCVKKFNSSEKFYNHVNKYHLK